MHKQESLEILPGSVEESLISPIESRPHSPSSSAHPSLKKKTATHDVMKSVGRILEAKFEELDNNFARSMELAELKVRPCPCLVVQFLYLHFPR
jgi:hypothetical protein